MNVLCTRYITNMNHICGQITEYVALCHIILYFNTFISLQYLILGYTVLPYLKLYCRIGYNVVFSYAMVDYTSTLLQNLFIILYFIILYQVSLYNVMLYCILVLVSCYTIQYCISPYYMIHYRFGVAFKCIMLGMHLLGDPTWMTFCILAMVIFLFNSTFLYICVYVVSDIS